MASFLTSMEPVAYAALRIVAGLLFTTHGAQKVFGLFGGREVDLLTLIGVAGIIETVAGPIIMLGFATTPLALLASGEMAFAYFLAHQPRGGWPLQNAGEPAVLFCFIFLLIAVRGGGRFSVDALLGWKLFRP